MCPLLITAHELFNRLGDEKLVVFDCRFQLTDVHKGRTDYLQGHIPGAFYLDLEQDLSGPVRSGSGRHPLPDPALLGEKLGAAGVDDDASVVVYDDGGGMAPRAWWLVRYLGKERVYVLDGGLQAWLNAGLPLSVDVPHIRPAQFPLQVHTDWVATPDDVEQVVAGRLSAQLVDARAPERFRGEVEPLDRVAGHIPGAVNRPWMEGLEADGTWRPAAEQRERFAALPVEKLVMYCGSGVTACANLFALHLAGVEQAKLYAGSWSEWCSDPRRPVAKGD